jgi:hypothetical protein
MIVKTCKTYRAVNCGFHPECKAMVDPGFKKRKKTAMWFVSIWGCGRYLK